MATGLDSKQIVTSEELLMSQVVSQDAYSGTIRTPIPEQSGHLFHLIPDSHSSPLRTVFSL